MWWWPWSSRRGRSVQCLTVLGRHNRRRKCPRLYARMNRDSLTRLATNRWHDSRVQFSAYFPSLTHCSAVFEGVFRFYNGRGTAVMFVAMKLTRGRRDGHGHRHGPCSPRGHDSFALVGGAVSL